MGHLFLFLKWFALLKGRLRRGRAKLRTQVLEVIIAIVMQARSAGDLPLGGVGNPRIAVPFFSLSPSRRFSDARGRMDGEERA